jgi:UDP-N-acetylmuramoyl-L-alanyl-D-glutamate--2,6-diaminopimelate ligase
MERLTVSPCVVLRDYAHTPDALERVLATARKLAGARRLAVVFGCGGDRDRGKRPLMGAIASRWADRVWVTSDNPRSEAPEAIVEEVVAGIPPAERAGRVVSRVDRREAIRAAVQWAEAGDVVLIAGKGHEPYQIVGTQVLPFDDREEARAAIAGRAR